jgi:hypothetical protein
MTMTAQTEHSGIKSARACRIRHCHCQTNDERWITYSGKSREHARATEALKNRTRPQLKCALRASGARADNRIIFFLLYFHLTGADIRIGIRIYLFRNHLSINQPNVSFFFLCSGKFFLFVLQEELLRTAASVFAV